MRVARNEYPPNYAAIAAVMPNAGNRGVLFCYGDTIYYPRPVAGAEIPEWLIRHEEIHSAQQATLAGGIEAWWDWYLRSPEFRLSQELPAHAMELWVWSQNWTAPRRQRLAMLSIIAHRLAGPLYNRMLTLHKAESFLRRAMKEQVT